MKDKVQHPGYWSLVLLGAALLVAAGEWGSLAELERWGQILEPNMFFSMLKALGPIVVAWASKPPLK